MWKFDSVEVDSNWKDIENRHIDQSNSKQRTIKCHIQNMNTISHYSLIRQIRTRHKKFRLYYNNFFDLYFMLIRVTNRVFPSTASS